jgi:hypothetical protein
MQNIIKKIVWVCLLVIPFIAFHVADGGLTDVLGWFSSINTLSIPLFQESRQQRSL